MGTLLISAVVALAVAAVLSLAILVFLAVKISQAQKEVVELVRTTRMDLVPAVRQAASELDSAARDARQKLERADKVMRAIERVADGTALALAVSRAVKGPGGAAAGLLAGLREAVRVLRKPTVETEEEAK